MLTLLQRYNLVCNYVKEPTTICEYLLPYFK